MFSLCLLCAAFYYNFKMENRKNTEKKILCKSANRNEKNSRAVAMAIDEKFSSFLLPVVFCSVFALPPLPRITLKSHKTTPTHTFAARVSPHPCAERIFSLVCLRILTSRSRWKGKKWFRMVLKATGMQKKLQMWSESHRNAKK